MSREKSTALDQLPRPQAREVRIRAGAAIFHRGDVDLSREFQNYFNLLMPRASGKIQTSKDERLIQNKDGGSFE